MTTRGFYIGFSVLLAAGFTWLALNIHGQYTASLCMFKNTTGIPCPACGTTSGIMQLFHGEIWNAILTNPLSIPAAFALAILPGWLLYDLLRKKESLYQAFRNTESIIKQKPVAIALVLMVVCNWIWNLIKLNG